MSKELDKIGREKTTVNVVGEVSKETPQTVFKTASQEDDSRKEAENEKKQKALEERLEFLQKELSQSEAAKRDAASVQEASIAEATPTVEAQDDGNGQSPTPTIETVEVLPLHGQLRRLDPDDIVALVRAIPVYTCVLNIFYVEKRKTMYKTSLRKASKDAWKIMVVLSK